jgi:hypothetical protein
MGPFVMFWLIGEAIIIYRSIKYYKAPPLPADILATSGLFIILAILAEWQPGLSTALAAGFDLAAFLAVASTKPSFKCSSNVAGGAAKGAKSGIGGIGFGVGSGIGNIGKNKDELKNGKSNL